MRLPARPLALRHGSGEVQQASHALGEPLLVHHDLVTLSVRDELEQEGHETAVPRGQPRGLKREALGAWGVIERLFHVGERGELVLQPPATGELDQQRLCGRVAAVQLSATAWLIRYAMHRSSFRLAIDDAFNTLQMILKLLVWRCSTYTS